MRLRFAYLKELYSKELLSEFLQNSTIHGLKVLKYPTSLHFARKIWFLFWLLILLWTHYIIFNLIMGYVEQPTEIQMDPKKLLTIDSPFPAIAICSANKFSKSKLLAYARDVFDAQQKCKPNLLAKNPEEMANHLLMLGSLYIYAYESSPKDEDLHKLHQILTCMYNNTAYPSRQILRNLAPNCEEIIIRGMTFGKLVNATKYFQKRMITTSVCCMFNYLRASDASNIIYNTSIVANAENIIFESVNVLNNVQFVLRNDFDEFTYTEMSNVAYQIYIFPSSDFAIQQSNTRGEILVSASRIVEIAIQPKYFRAKNEIRAVSPKKRNCYFTDEGVKLLNRSYYSLDECLLECRMRNMEKHCGCVNPTMPLSIYNATFCNLIDVPCLTRWKSIWYKWSQFPYIDENNNENDAGASSYGTCGMCLPTCNGVYYQITSNELPLRNAKSRTNDIYKVGFLKNLSSNKPLSIIKLHYQKTFAQVDTTDIVDNWVVLLNRFGGIMSLMYGFGVISYIEMLYYLTGKWFLYLVRKFKAKRQLKQQKIIRQKHIFSVDTEQKIKDAKDNKLKNQIIELYWHELQPKFERTKTFQIDRKL